MGVSHSSERQDTLPQDWSSLPVSSEKSVRELPYLLKLAPYTSMQTILLSRRASLPIEGLGQAHICRLACWVVRYMLYLLEVGKCESNKNDTKEPSEASPESHDGFLYQRLKAPREMAPSPLGLACMVLWLKVSLEQLAARSQATSMLDML